MSRWVEAVRRRPLLRVPVKAGGVVLLAVMVCFPHLPRLARHLVRVSNLQAMIEPHAPDLAQWDGPLRERLEKTARVAAAKDTGPPFEAAADWGELLQRLPPRQVQAEVERFVYERVSYAWDWELWWNADYLPTVAEIFARAAAGDGVLREDCDGRAVMAASLMRRLGYESSLVTDLRHVWVVTPQGEWMGPGRAKTLISTPEGNRLALRTAWTNVPASLAYGLAVFPLWRELVILGGAFLLVRHPRTPPRIQVLAALILLAGLLFMRCGGADPRGAAGFSAWWPVWVGLLHWAAGFGTLAVCSHRARREAAARAGRTAAGEA